MEAKYNMKDFDMSMIEFKKIKESIQKEFKYSSPLSFGSEYKGEEVGQGFEFSNGQIVKGDFTTKRVGLTFGVIEWAELVEIHLYHINRQNSRLSNNGD